MIYLGGKNMKMNESFREIQRMKQWWVWLILILANGNLLYGCYRQLILNIPFGNNPANDTWLVIITMITILITVGIGLLKLDTYIDKTAIYVRFLPFQQNYKVFSWDNIESYEIRRYNPIMEFGGWGYRLTAKRKKAYSMYGRIGLELKMVNGRVVLIGTQRGEEMHELLNQLRESSKK